jgi:CheY-like chemotaxis protein
MLTYAGKGKVVVEVLDVSSVVEDMSRLLEVSISKKCEIKYEFLEGLPSIEADVSQMRQVIMNLIINASEAIGDQSGVIKVSTGVMYCDNTYLSGTYHYEKLPEGQYVYLEVSDNGCGMSEETRAKVFDPFFTTKFSGHGLGLSALLGIVRSHSGAVKVYSESGKGTTFRVFLPASNKPAKPRDVSGVKLPHWCGRGFALIVDDEESVRGLARVMLEEMGFSVLTASDGKEDVEVFRRESDRISVVLLDMTMPHMDGEEVFREMRRIRKDVPTILSSGYNEKSATVRFAGLGLAGFIQKPYGYNELLAIVRKMLES